MIGTAAPATDLSADYQNVLTGGQYASGGTPCTVTLNGLTPGNEYLVQLWVDDSRSNERARHETVTIGSSTVTVRYTSSNNSGGVGQYTIGSFVATASTQVITLTGNASTQINALQLRDLGLYPVVPPPTFTPPAGPYLGALPVTISSPGTIFYTTNGTTPTASSAVYTSPVIVPAGVTMTIKAFATNTAQSDSSVASATYNTFTSPAVPTWVNAAGGSWTNTANWSNNVVANGSGATADISVLNLTADATVTLDSAPTIGNLIFGDTTPDHNWILNAGSGGPLTLASGSTPTITVNNQTATINPSLNGDQGLTKTGNGTLTLAAGHSPITGTLDVVNGTLDLPTGASGYWHQWCLSVTNINLSPGTALTCASGAFGWYGNNSSDGLTIHVNGAVCQPNGAFGVAYVLTGGTIGTGSSRLDLGRSGGFDSSISSLASSTTSVVNPSGGIMLRPDAASGDISQPNWVITAEAGTTPSGIDLDIQKPISQNGGTCPIIKTGSGTLRLSGANSGYSGGTEISGGTLVVSALKANGTGAVTLDDNTVLVTYASGGSSTIQNTGVLSLGTGAGTNALNFAALTSTTVAPVSVSSVSGVNPVTVNILSLAPFVGHYPLIKTTGGGAFSALTLGSYPAGYTMTLVDDTGGTSQSVYLDVTTVPVPPTVTWTGVNNGVWDINTTTNWTTNSVNTVYQEPDFTVFNDTATTKAITLNTTVNPDGVTFSNSVAYSLSGTGGIAGFTGLTKVLNGTLTIGNTNSYTGETVVGAGTLQLNNGSLATSDITNSGAVIYSNTISQTVGYPITGTGSLTKNGNGTLTMSVDAPVSGGLTVNAGTLRVTAGNFAGRFTASPITINPNATILNDTYHALGGSTTSLTINHGTWLLNYEDYKQNITMMDGLIASGGGGNGGNLRIGYAGGGGTYYLHVTNSVAGSVISESVNTITSSLFWVLDAARGAAASDLTISGVIANAGNIIKNGNGIVTFTAANTYTGSTTINAGTLALSGNGSISNAITIGGGATFDVTARSSSPMVLGSSQIISNSTSTAVIKGSVDASAGDLELTFAAGTPALAIGNGTFTLSPGTVINIDNTGAPLANATLKLIATNTAGAVGGTVPASVNLYGNGLAAGATATVTNINSELYLAVVGGVATNPTNITVTVTGGLLTLAWPPDHLGWSLQVQTNALTTGLGNNWVTIPGSETVNTTNFPVDPAQPAVFYRLIYP